VDEGCGIRVNIWPDKILNFVLPLTYMGPALFIANFIAVPWILGDLRLTFTVIPWILGPLGFLLLKLTIRDYIPAAGDSGQMGSGGSMKGFGVFIVIHPASFAETLLEVMGLKKG
jgi:hypothetical protein